LSIADINRNHLGFSDSLFSVFFEILMFRRMITWLDSWDDRINPIIVRELRRGVRSECWELFVLFFWFAALILYAFFLICCPDDVRKNNGWFFLFVPVIILIVIFLLNLSFLFLFKFKTHRTLDELLDAVPLSPRRQLHGYWATLSIYSFFSCCFFYPFIVIGQLIEPIPYVFFFMPIAAFLVSQMIILVLLSFSARLKQEWEFNVLSFFSQLLGYLPAIFIYRRISRSYSIFIQWDQGFSFVSLFILLPAVLLIIGYVAYQLALYGFKTWQKPLWKALLLNLAVYLLLTFTLAAIGFAITFAVKP
jgi:hypothetical protein